MKYLYLHIGYGKTGSSALQSWLANNAELLRLQGVSYAGTNAVARKYRVSSGNAHLLLAFLRGEEVTPAELDTYYFDGMSSALVSSETLQAFKVNDFQNLRDAISPFGITVVFVAFIRNIYNHNYSNYVQAVKRRGSLQSFQEWADRELNVYPLTHSMSLMNEFNLILLKYEEHISNLSMAFCDACGLDHKMLGEMRQDKVNRTLTSVEIKVLQKFGKIADTVGGLGIEFARRISDYLVNFVAVEEYGIPLNKQIVLQLESQCGKTLSRFNEVACKKYGFSLTLLNSNGYVSEDFAPWFAYQQAKWSIVTVMLSLVNVASNRRKLLRFSWLVLPYSPVSSARLAWAACSNYAGSLKARMIS